MKIVASDTGQRPNSDRTRFVDRQGTGYREGGLEKKAKITSSPPPKVGCDRTVTDGCNPLESKHGLDRDIYRLRKFSPPPK
jgi:hypothetical protein